MLYWMPYWIALLGVECDYFGAARSKQLATQTAVQPQLVAGLDGADASLPTLACSSLGNSTDGGPIGK